MEDEKWQPRRKADRQIIIGEDLAHLSLEDLSDRLAEVRQEINRIEMAIKAKQQQASLADDLFKSDTE